MNDKVRIGEGDTRASDRKAELEEQRANKAVRALGDVRRRIRTFYKEVHFVSFEDADGAPAWAEKWLDYLLDGTVPEPEPAEEPVGEQRAETEPTDVALDAGGDPNIDVGLVSSEVVAPEVVEGIDQAGS